MTSPVQLRQAVQEKMQQYEPVLPQFPALLGDGRGTVAVDGRPGYVYVRVGVERALAQAFNQRVLPRDDSPVIVGYRHEQPGLFQVLCLREVYMGLGTGDDFTPEIINHHEIHELRNPGGGDDVVWIPTQQITPLLGYPTNPVSMQVEIMAGLYGWRGGYQYFEGATSASLTEYKPSSPGRSQVVIISIDGTDNATLLYTVGDNFPTEWPPEDFDARIPKPPGGCVPSTAVILANSTTSIGWNELWDVRLWLQSSSGGGASIQQVGALEAEIDFQLTQMRIGLDNDTMEKLNWFFGHLEAAWDLQMSRHVVEGG